MGRGDQIRSRRCNERALRRIAPALRGNPERFAAGAPGIPPVSRRIAWDQYFARTASGARGNRAGQTDPHEDRLEWQASRGNPGPTVEHIECGTNGGDVRPHAATEVRR